MVIGRIVVHDDAGPMISDPSQLDSVNGLDPQRAAQRPHFAELTPLHPQQRLRLETPAGPPTARIIDLAARPAAASWPAAWR